MISNGIGVNIHYRPIYQHKIFNINKTLKGAEEYYSGAVSLPIYPSIKIKDLEKIVDVMLNYNNQ
jgi:dTDP-4-amino-4,6-dideoxygalactose transaminase